MELEGLKMEHPLLCGTWQPLPADKREPIGQSREGRKVGAAFEGHRIVGGWWGLRHYTGDLPTFLI